MTPTPLSPQVQEWRNKLHAEILALRCRPVKGTAVRREFEDEPEAILRAYIEGHRDARHAAAELALSAVPFNQVVQEPVAWMRFDGLKAMPDAEKRAYEEATDKLSKYIASEYTTPLYAQPVSQPGEGQEPIDEVPIFDHEQSALYEFTRGTRHYDVVRTLYRLAYAQVNGQPGEALPAEQPKSDKANLTAPVPSEGLQTAPPENTRDAARYRWLRDKSEPGICAFFLSVGEVFKGVKFARETVDEAIDAQIDAMSNTEGAKP